MKRYERALSLAEMAALPDTALDFSEIPEVDDAFWQTADVRVPERRKVPLNLGLDADLVAWFRSQGRGYQTRINAVLRSFYQAHAQPPTKPR